ncbi:hypothetical protein K458DRAFT_416074 [Lentithecium fluviatile CBS 122367]|uniref:Uncharacterized protein n=1 Tax=Lentithecium fluviatile CBS 122367 TaxID=1168545 RepID=A0A6G1J839_9PLEO|nr:hypothetical protein K458DRAFT_416074 [Lentithecium fluviatile CBS 122367]
MSASSAGTSSSAVRSAPCAWPRPFQLTLAGTSAVETVAGAAGLDLGLSAGAPERAGRAPQSGKGNGPLTLACPRPGWRAPT